MSAAARGDVWLVDFGDLVGHEQGYRRPAVVLSADRLNRSRAGLVIVVPVTTSRRGLPSHVEIEVGVSGLTQTSYAKVEDLKSISTARLVRRLGTTPIEVMHRLATIVRTLLDV